MRQWVQPGPKSNRKPGGKGCRNGIAAVLIVKDEEKVLERCLKSLDRVDQIVILPKMEPFHFGDARNYALKFVKQDWCLTIDADEVVKEGAVDIIRKAFWRMSKAVGFNVTFTLYDEQGQNPSSLMKLKIFRHGRWEWQYRIHEILFCNREPMTVGQLPEAVIEHYPSPDKAARRQQNLDLLQIAVKESPEYVRNGRQLGMEFFTREDFQSAAKWLKLYLDMSKSDRMDRSETMILLARCYSNMGRYDLAEPYFDQAVGEAPERREIYYYKSVALTKAMHLEEAIEAVKQGMAIPASAMPDFHLNLAGAWNGTAFQEVREFCENTLSEAKAEYERRKAAAR